MYIMEGGFKEVESEMDFSGSTETEAHPNRTKDSPKDRRRDLYIMLEGLGVKINLQSKMIDDC